MRSLSALLACAITAASALTAACTAAGTGGAASTPGPNPASAPAPLPSSAPASPAAAAGVAATPPAPASAAIDGSVKEAPAGTAAAAGDAWSVPAHGEILGTFPLTLVRGLQDVEPQSRTLQGQLTETPAAGVDASKLRPGAWLHGAVPVTNVETIPFAVSAARDALVLDSDRDGALETHETLGRAEIWGGVAWFEGTVVVRQALGGKVLQCAAPVRVGAMLQQPRMATRLDGRREGVARIGGRDVRLAVLDQTFRGWFSQSRMDALVVDADGDGRLDGSADSAERYRLGEPFPAGEVDAVVTAVGPFGSTVTLAKSTRPALRKASLRMGSPAPDFETSSLDGKPVKLSSLEGKWVLLDFWATWCGPCRNELPHLKELRRQHPDVVIVGISGDDTAEAVTGFVKAQSMDWPQVHAGARKVMQQYRVTSFPTSFVVAPDGTLAARDLRGPGVASRMGQLKAGFKPSR